MLPPEHGEPRNEGEHGPCVTGPIDATAVPNLRRSLETAARRGLYAGVQVYVSMGGEVLADCAVTAEGAPALGPDSIVSWRCATKPAVAVAVAQLWEDGALDLDEPIGSWLPCLHPSVGGSATSRHLLSHRVRFRHDPPAESLLPLRWDALMQALGRLRLMDDTQPGREQWYSQWCNWSVLGAVIQAITDDDPASIVKGRVFDAIDASDCWLAVPRSAYTAYGDRIAVVCDQRPGRHEWQALRDGVDACDRTSPPDGARGPARQLARLYEVFLAGGTPLLRSSDTVAAMLRPTPSPLDEAPKRRNMFARRLEWGLGFLCDPEGLGPACGGGSFGHRNLESTITLAEPALGLVVVMLFTSLIDDVRSSRRNYALLRELYRDVRTMREHGRVPVPVEIDR